MSATTIRLQMVGHKLGTIQKYCEQLSDCSLAVTTTEATKRNNDFEFEAITLKVICRMRMTSIVIDEGTSDEKLYMGGGYNPALGGTSVERYPKLLSVYDVNAKTWRLYSAHCSIPSPR